MNSRPNPVMDPHVTYMSINDLARRAKRRLPHFVWEFLASGTGDESTVARNRSELDAVGFLPSILHGEVAADLRTPFLGQDFNLPFGIAPVGMSGLIHPGAELTLAREAKRLGLPYCLSTVASMPPEEVGPAAQGTGWFQLYPAKDPEIRADLLARAKGAGFHTLVVTVDLPVASRRERQVQSGLTQPPRMTTRIIAQCAARPTWSIRRALAGMPQLATLTKYADTAESRDPTKHIGYLLRAAPDWDYLRWLRENWTGPFIVKGVMRAKDAAQLEAEGVDAIWVSNHGGRQFAGAPGAAQVLPDIRRATTLPILFDSGIASGLDMIRAFALGADFVMLGRAWHYALAAMGDSGPDHLAEILKRDLIANLGQLGAAHPRDLRDAWVHVSDAIGANP